MNNFYEEIEECEDCRKFGNRVESSLKFQPKACIVFHAYSKWCPKEIENLFIAEAPPFQEPKYFYNTEIKSGILRKGLLAQLKIDDQTEGFETFSKRNFLIDAIKCRLDKDSSRVPPEIIKNCANRFLRREISSLKPKRIILLGDTAKQGLACLSEYAFINQYRVKQDCGTTIEVNGCKIILYMYPSTRNLREMKAHPLANLLS